MVIEGEGNMVKQLSEEELNFQGMIPHDDRRKWDQGIEAPSLCENKGVFTNALSDFKVNEDMHNQVTDEPDPINNASELSMSNDGLSSVLLTIPNKHADLEVTRNKDADPAVIQNSRADPEEIECMQEHAVKATHSTGDGNTEVTQKDPCQKKYVLSRRRWFILAVYCLLTLSATSSWFCFTAVTNILKIYYSQSLLNINFLSLVFGIAIVSFAPLFSFLSDKYEFAVVLKMAAALNTTGAIIRYFGDEPSTTGYALLVIGNSFTAISVAGFLFLPGKIAANWFGEKEVGKAVATCIAFDFLGTGLGFIHATSMIHNSDVKELVQVDVKRFLLSQIIPACVVLPLVFLTVRERPPSPPSKLEAMRLQLEQNRTASTTSPPNQAPTPKSVSSESPRPSYLKSMINLFRNRDFAFIMIRHGIVQAIEGVYEVLLNEILIAKYPGREKDIGIVGFVGVVLGFISSIAAGAYIDRAKSYRRITLAIFLCSTLLSSAWAVIIELSDNFILTSVVFCSLLFVTTAYYSVAFANGCDLTFPISPGLTGVVLIVSSQIFGTAMMFLITELLERFGVLVVLCTTIAMAALAGVISVIPERKRSFVASGLVNIGMMTINVNRSMTLGGAFRPTY